MSGRPIRVVVAGLGSHATKAVLPAIGTSESWHLAGVVSSRPEAAAAASSDHGVAGYTTIAEALDAGDADAVYVASRPVDHQEACLEAMAGGAGIVVCEKPLGPNAAAARTIVDEARARSVVLCEVMAYQHHPQFRVVADLLNAGQIGDLTHGYARFSYPHLGDDNHRYRPEAGGGALLDAGVYPLSMAVTLLGTADLDVQATRYDAGRDVDVAGTATLTDARGRSFQCSWEMGSAYTNLARLVGTSGTIEISRPFSKPPTFAEPVTLIGGWGERTAVDYAARDQFAAMLDDVARHRDDAAWITSTLQATLDRWSVIDRVQAAAS